MGIVEFVQADKVLLVHSVFHFYGNAADEALSKQIAKDISDQWNEPAASVYLNKEWYDVHFQIEGMYRHGLTPEEVIENTDARNNYFRIENFAAGNISFVDDIGSNTGYFLKENLLDHSTTAAHEYGHTLGLHHPVDLDIRGKGIPGLMYPRGTLVDPEFQYDPAVPAGMKGGTLNPFKRKVLLSDIDHLNLHALEFIDGVAILGDFTSCWHEAHEQ